MDISHQKTPMEVVGTVDSVRWGIASEITVSFPQLVDDKVYPVTMVIVTKGLLSEGELKRGQVTFRFRLTERHKRRSRFNSLVPLRPFYRRNRDF